MIALLFWLVLLGGYQLYAWRSGLTPREAAEHVIQLMTIGAAGALDIDWRRFALATLLGSLPAILSLVLFGASLETNFTASGFRLNPLILLASAVLFVASLLLSRYLKRRKIATKAATP